MFELTDVCSIYQSSQSLTAIEDFLSHIVPVNNDRGVTALRESLLTVTPEKFAF